MDSKKIISICIFFGIIFSIITGLGVYSFTNKRNRSNKDSVVQIGDSGKSVEYNSVQTVSSEERISPTAQVVMNQYYKKCGHTTKNKYSVPEEIINMNEKQVQKYYYGWKIDKFSSSELILSKVNPGICDEHYVVKDVDGLVNVYNLDDDGAESLVYSTEIETKYLPQEDREKLKNGINIVGKDNLSILLEDYE